MCNVVGMLCERGFDEAFSGDVIEAKKALFRANLRHREGNNRGFDGPSLKAVRRVLDLHAAQIDVAGQGQLVALWREVTRRTAAGDVVWADRKN